MAEILEHLTTKMAAVVAYKPHDYRFEERKVPRPAPGEMLIRVKSTGICGSDIKRFTGAPLYWGDEHRPPSCQAPVTPGPRI